MTTSCSRHRRAIVRPRNLRAPCSGLIGLAALLAAPHLARGADVTSRWASGASGSWENNANWLNTPANGGFPTVTKKPATARKRKKS